MRAIIAARPPARSSSQSAAVRRSCQTMALAIGWPVARSHSTVVSRWFVMPMAATSRAPMPARASASCITPRLRRPDLVGVVLDPARLRENLPKFLLRDRADSAGMIEDERARTGRALIECEDE